MAEPLTEAELAIIDEYLVMDEVPSKWGDHPNQRLSIMLRGHTVVELGVGASLEARRAFVKLALQDMVLRIVEGRCLIC